MRKKKKKRRYVTYGVRAKKKPRLTMRFIAKWSLVALIVIGTAVGHVWQRNTIISLGYDIHRLGKDIKAAEEEGLKLRAALAKMQRPDRIWEEVLRKDLGLQKISPGQVMELETPPPFHLPPTKPGIADYPPAVSGIVAKVSVTAPHRDTSVSRSRR